MTDDFRHLRLIRPDIRFSASFAGALEEGLFTEPSTPDEIAWVREDFDGWLRVQEDTTRKIVTPDGREVPRVPETTYWMVEGDEFIGRVGIRPQLNAFLEKMGGHVGYAIRASRRGQGYGTAILEMTLPKAKRLGLQKILVTCDDDNAASAKIIERCGGVLQDTIRVEGHSAPMRRYWISLTPSNIKEKAHVG